MRPCSRRVSCALRRKTCCTAGTVTSEVPSPAQLEHTWAGCGRKDPRGRGCSLPPTPPCTAAQAPLAQPSRRLRDPSAPREAGHRFPGAGGQSPGPAATGRGSAGARGGGGAGAGRVKGGPRPPGGRGAGLSGSRDFCGGFTGKVVAGGGRGHPGSPGRLGTGGPAAPHLPPPTPPRSRSPGDRQRPPGSGPGLRPLPPPARPGTHARLARLPDGGSAGADPARAPGTPPGLGPCPELVPRGEPPPQSQPNLAPHWPPPPALLGHSQPTGSGRPVPAKCVPMGPSRVCSGLRLVGTPRVRAATGARPRAWAQRANRAVTAGQRQRRQCPSLGATSTPSTAWHWLWHGTARHGTVEVWRCPWQAEPGAWHIPALPGIASQFPTVGNHLAPRLLPLRG